MQSPARDGQCCYHGPLQGMFHLQAKGLKVLGSGLRVQGAGLKALGEIQILVAECWKLVPGEELRTQKVFPAGRGRLPKQKAQD